MGSPITFSGFNNIDFSLVLNSIMQAENAPLQALQDRQTSVQSRIANFKTLATKVATLEGSAESMASANSLASFAATTNDSSAVSVSAGSSAIAGHYDLVVSELARAQVTAAASAIPDANATVVATGGAISINGHPVAIAQGVTLQQLADAINATADVPVTASIVQSGASSFRLVLTARATGQANGFTITNTLTGGAGLAFTDTDNDGVSGDSTADNAVQATDASLLVNNIAVTSASNTLDAVIPGVSVTLLKKDAAKTVSVDVATDPSALKNKVSGFILAYNELVKFIGTQMTSAASGDPASIGREPIVRQLKNSLRGLLADSYGGGAATNLSHVGVEFTHTGTLTLKDAAFADAVKNGVGGLSGLFSGTTGTPGVFASINTFLQTYTDTNGTLPDIQEQLSAKVTNLSAQIARMQDRLALRRLALQKEFTAADQAMSALKNQSGALAQFGTSLF